MHCGGTIMLLGSFFFPRNWSFRMERLLHEHFQSQFGAQTFSMTMIPSIHDQKWPIHKRWMPLQSDIWWFVASSTDTVAVVLQVPSKKQNKNGALPSVTTCNILTSYSDINTAPQCWENCTKLNSELYLGNDSFTYHEGEPEYHQWNQ